MRMSMRHAAVMAGLALGLMLGTANASYVVTFTQTDAGVLATGVGEFDFNPGTSVTGQAISAVAPSDAFVAFGSGQIDYQYPFNVTGPALWGSGGYTTADSSTGDPVSLDFGQFSSILLPENYIPGAELSSTAFYNQATLESLGLDPGVYSYKHSSSGANDSVTVNVISPVPLPASAPMFGAAVLALGTIGYGLKRKSKAAAAA